MAEVNTAAVSAHLWIREIVGVNETEVEGRTASGVAVAAVDAGAIGGQVVADDALTEGSVTLPEEGSAAGIGPVVLQDAAADQYRTACRKGFDGNGATVAW